MGVNLKLTMPRRAKRSGGGSFVIVYTGTIRRAWGIETLLKGIALAKNQIPNLQLVLAGQYQDKRYRDVVKNLIQELGLEESVKYLGFLPHEQVLDVIAEADVCAIPLLKHEVFKSAYPLKLFEYMALGKPVVATDLACTRRVIQHGTNGFLVSSEKPEEWAAVFLELYRNPALREQVAQNARKSIQEYDWERINGTIERKMLDIL